jgi:hypothetical protein
LPRCSRRTGQRVAAERAEANGPDLGLLAVFERQAVVVDRDQHAVTVNHRAGCREIKRDDRNSLLMDVEPDVELGPIQEREGPYAFISSLETVVEPPRLRPLLLGIPVVVPVTK